VGSSKREEEDVCSMYRLVDGILLGFSSLLGHGYSVVDCCLLGRNCPPGLKNLASAADVEFVLQQHELSLDNTTFTTMLITWDTLSI